MGDEGLLYEELDPPVVKAVRALNRLPGIGTGTSCGGHEKPISAGSLPPDRWMVGFDLEPWDRGALIAVPTREAWVSLEWLAWLVNDDTDYSKTPMKVPVDRPYSAEVVLRPWSRPPYLYYPGRTLQFVIEGRRAADGMEPDEFAELVERLAQECYIPADETWPYGEDGPFDATDDA